MTHGNFSHEFDIEGVPAPGGDHMPLQKAPQEVEVPQKIHHFMTTGLGVKSQGILKRKVPLKNQGIPKIGTLPKPFSQKEFSLFLEAKSSGRGNFPFKDLRQDPEGKELVRQVPVTVT